MTKEPFIFQRRWMMCDIARERVFDRDEFILLLDTLQRLGFNGLCVYMEGAFAFSSMPGVIREGVMTADDAKWLCTEAEKRGIEICPITNVVCHMEHFFDQERNRPLMSAESELQINFLDPRAEAFVLNFVDELCAAFGTRLFAIGGDEAALAPDTKLLYAKFLGKICTYLLDRGIQPAIFDDMIWMNPDLTDEIDRRTLLLDWNYYGHRPESVAFFTEKGFSDIVVCTCDDSWEGLINYQRSSGHLKAHPEIHVNPDDIEAFYADARSLGCGGAMMCNWENTYGRNLWMNWVPLARTSLFLQGKMEEGERCDEKIEQLLFGRITPYTACTYRFQNEIQRGEEIPFQWFMDMRNALFEPAYLRRLLASAQKEIPDFPDTFTAPLEKIEADMLDWIPASPFEEKCRAALGANAAMVRAACALVRAGSAYRYYRRAAEMQFTAETVSRQLVLTVKNAFLSAAGAVRAYADSLEAAISGTGHTKNDLDRLQKTASLLDMCAEEFAETAKTLVRIPMPRFELLLDRVLPTV